MSNKTNDSVGVLNWQGTPTRVIQDVEVTTLRDRDDSTNRLEITTSLKEAEGLESEQELIFRQRRFAINRVYRRRSDKSATIEADEVQAELAGIVMEDFTVDSWTLEDALNKALEGTLWQIGTIEGVRYGRAYFEDISVLQAVQFLARHQGGYLHFDSRRRWVNITQEHGTVHDHVFTYGRELFDMEKDEQAPRLNVIYPTGADGMTIADINDGELFVADFGYYLAQGLTWQQAWDKHRKIEHWFDERYTVQENMMRDCETRLEDEAYPRITYSLHASATNPLHGGDDFDLSNIHLGDWVYVWDQDTDIKTRAQVTAVTSSTDPELNRLVLSVLPESLGDSRNHRYFGDSGNPNSSPQPPVDRSGPQPRPSTPILVEMGDLGVGTFRWNGLDHEGNFNTIPQRFGSVEAVAMKLNEDGTIPSPSSVEAFGGTVINRRDGGTLQIAFGGPGDFAVWFYMRGWDGVTLSEFSEPWVGEAPAYVDAEGFQDAIDKATEKLDEAIRKAQEDIDNFEAEWNEEWDEEHLKSLRDRQDTLESDLSTGLSEANQAISSFREEWDENWDPEAMDELRGRQDTLEGDLTTGLDSVYERAERKAEELAGGAVVEAAQNAQAEYERLERIAEEAASRGVNRIQNPSFETGDFTGWRTVRTAFGVAEDPTSYHGNHFMRMVSEDGWAVLHGLSRAQVSSGQVWRLRAHVRLAEIYEGVDLSRARMMVMFRTDADGSDWATVQPLVRTLPVGEWTRIESTLVIPGSGSVNEIWAKIQMNNHFFGEIHVDDVSLVDITEAHAAAQAAEAARQAAEAARQEAIDAGAEAALARGEAAQLQTRSDELQELAERALETAVTQAGNLYPDPSFEHEGAGLTPNPRWEIAQSSAARHGSHVMRFTGAGGAGPAGAMSQPLVWEPGNRAYVSVWVNRTSSSQTGDLLVRVRRHREDAGSLFTNVIRITLDDMPLNEWTKFEGQYANSNDDTAGLHMFFQQTGDVNLTGLLVDNVLLADITQAHAALQAAEDAQKAAEEAHKAAGEARDLAVTAQDTASGKADIIRQTTAPTGTAPEGSIWFRYDNMTANRKLIGWWVRESGAWRSQEMDETILPQVNIGTGTYGDLDGDRLTANSVRAGALSVVPDGRDLAPDLVDYADLWTLSSQVSIESSSAAESGLAFRVAGDASAAGGRAYGPWIPVREGDTIYYKVSLGFYAPSVPDGALRIYVMYNGSVTLWTRLHRATSTGTYEGHFTVPRDGTTKISFAVTVDTPATNGGDWAVRDFDVRVAAKGVHIQPQGIKSPQIDTAELTASNAFLDNAMVNLIQGRMANFDEAIIGGALLKDNSVSVSKLAVIPNVTDYAPDPGEFPELWDLLGASIVASTGADDNPSNVAFRFNQRSGDTQVRGPVRPVTPGKQIRFRGRYTGFGSGTSGSNVHVRMEWSGDLSPGRDGFSTFLIIPTSASLGWRSATVTVPEWAEYGRLYFYQSSNSGRDMGFHGSIQCEPMVGSVLIEDGAVKAEHVDSVSLTASNAFLDNAMVNLIQGRMANFDQALIGNTLLKDGAITLEKLVVAPGNLISDRSFETLNDDDAILAWRAGAGGLWYTSGSTADGYPLVRMSQSDANSSQNMNLYYGGWNPDAAALPCQPDDRFRMRFRIHRYAGSSNNDDFQLVVWFSDASGQSISSTFIQVGGNPTSNRVFSFTAPEGAVRFRVQFRKIGSAQGARGFAIRSLEKMTSGVLIEDGAITTPKLTVTEDMVASFGQFLKIDVGHLNFNTMTGMNLVSGEIRSSMVTGSTFQTHTQLDSGVTIRNNGSMEARPASGGPATFVVDTNGNVRIEGSLRTNYSGQTISLETVRNRPRIHINTNLPGQAQPNIFAAMDGNTAWETGDFVMSGHETTINSSGRSDLVLGPGNNGRARLSKSFGDYSGQGFHINRHYARTGSVSIAGPLYAPLGSTQADTTFGVNLTNERTLNPGSSTVFTIATVSPDSGEFVYLAVTEIVGEGSVSVAVAQRNLIMGQRDTGGGLRVWVRNLGTETIAYRIRALRIWRT